MFVPLAERMRPTCLDEYVGQDHLLASGKPLRRALEVQHLHSMLFWGPPGTGKTTLARLIAHYWDAEYITLSAVLAGVKDIRQTMDQAQTNKDKLGKETILFVDEVHRFNKAQQDAFLPYIESGLIIFIGATTENPSFELNNALLSRTRVYVLKALTEANIIQVINQAIESEYLSKKELITSDTIDLFANMADGDARRALSWLETAFDMVGELDSETILDVEMAQEVVGSLSRRFDKHGDMFYDQISALHKSIRGTDPDASLYWFCRMLEAGCDPIYLARRLVRIASEDIGNADPRALQLCLNAWDSYDRLGSPEGDLALAQATIYLACAPKSNAVYMAFKQAMQDAKKFGSLEVPLHLRNSVTTLENNLGYGKDYRYNHNETDVYAVDQTYFPESLENNRYYFPVERGLEVKIKNKLDFINNKKR